MQERGRRFEWDEKKAMLNLLKHGIHFEDAARTFFDPNFIRLLDPKHSEAEVRYAGIGQHPMGGVLVTIYTERGESFRIISSRRANKKERQMYEDAKE